MFYTVSEVFFNCGITGVKSIKYNKEYRYGSPSFGDNITCLILKKKNDLLFSLFVLLVLDADEVGHLLNVLLEVLYL